MLMGAVGQPPEVPPSRARCSRRTCARRWINISGQGRL